MSSSEKRERFGRYLILDHLVDGGMAKICRARFLGEQADKIVAIKMVQPQYSKDEAFSSMFMDEIKVTFGLIHPNIVQTYDYGFNLGQLFVAMEYCDGKNLKEYLEKLKERKFVFPVEVSTYIISQACQGLFYAHTFRDKLTGLESHIIHRDISPHNIMLTYDGAVKIIDFGIAKSQKSSEATQAGTIKGKLSYLAPEYLEGIELDARYDQFALGITFWEMLCSRKLFKENNDLAVLKKIQECKIPAPSSVNPNVPKELDEIVLKALSKDRSKRFENLDQMNRALMKFLYAKYPDFNATDLSYFSQELFRDEIKKDREKLFEYGKIQIRPYLDDLKRELEGNKSDSSIDPEKTIIKKENLLDFGFEPKESDTKSRGKLKQTQTTKRGQELKDHTSYVNGDLSSTNGRQNKTIVTSSGVINKSENLIDTKKSIEKTRITQITQYEKIEETPSRKWQFIASFILIIVLSGSYFYYKNMQLEEADNAITSTLRRGKKKGPRPASVENEKEVEEVEKGSVLLTHFDKQKMQVFIDGEKAILDSIGLFKIPLNKDVAIRVQIEGKQHYVQNIKATNTAVMEIEIPELPSVAYGYINTNATCAKGEISFELWTEKRTASVPFKENIGIPFPIDVDKDGNLIPTTHTVYFRMADRPIEKKVEFTLNKEEETIDLCEKIN